MDLTVPLNFLLLQRKFANITANCLLWHDGFGCSFIWQPFLNVYHSKQIQRDNRLLYLEAMKIIILLLIVCQANIYLLPAHPKLSAFLPTHLARQIFVEMNLFLVGCSISESSKI